ncbi:DUF4249 domain-containing protein [Reichenbachiella sp.]|uniref:DUF4249 domain-containing protein n=1 Tax=Reichenbachiella sp. TaxID=2184521 RepID=UPI003BB04796
MCKYKSIMLLLIGFIGCVEPYDFEVGGTVEVLVVEAEFSNQQESHRVMLSISRGLDNDVISPVSGAAISIIEDETEEINLTEIESGIYETSPSVAGKVGSIYRLSIKLKDGSTFQSSSEILSNPVPIDSVWGRYLELPSEEEDGLIQGVQLFVDTHDFNSEASYFRYEYQEDYQVKAAFPSLLEWNNDTETYGPRDFPIGTCYEQANSQGLLITTTSGLSENRLSEFPIRMIQQKDPELRGKYAIVLKQFAISENGYRYYKNLRENNESAGSFFDKQKGTIPGNISSVDSSMPVLGYFEVAGLSTDTAFFHSSNFRDQGFKPDQFSAGDCLGSGILEVSIGELNNQIMQGNNLIYVDVLSGVAALATIPCSDCRVHADIKKPEYWD